MALPLYSLTLFKNDHIEFCKKGLPLEVAYKTLPDYIFGDANWFVNNAKDTNLNLETLLLGESYRVAWSRNQSEYILITKTGEPNSIIMVESRSPNLSNRGPNTSYVALPPSDDEEDKAKDINYQMICSRYTSTLKSILETYIFKKPLLPLYSEPK